MLPVVSYRMSLVACWLSVLGRQRGMDRTACAHRSSSHRWHWLDFFFSLFLFSVFCFSVYVLDFLFLVFLAMRSAGPGKQRRASWGSHTPRNLVLPLPLPRGAFWFPARGGTQTFAFAICRHTKLQHGGSLNLGFVAESSRHVYVHVHVRVRVRTLALHHWGGRTAAAAQTVQHFGSDPALRRRVLSAVAPRRKGGGGGGTQAPRSCNAKGAFFAFRFHLHFHCRCRCCCCFLSAVRWLFIAQGPAV